MYSNRRWTELFLSDRGNAVLAGLANIVFATLITLSVLALAMAGYYSLVIRDLAIESASKLANYGAPSQREYLLQRLQLSLPELAQFKVYEQKGEELTQITVQYWLPGMGLVKEPVGQISVQAATERI